MEIDAGPIRRTKVNSNLTLIVVLVSVIHVAVLVLMI